jgi:ArsR family transcriptional regulator, arsenate/arsenite/antimonite-responsive transcriptional repressor
MSNKRVPGPAAPECCPSLTAAPLTEEQAEALAPIFKAFADPVRLRLMSMIASTTEICVNDLASEFNVTGPTISYHLRILREANLVDSKRRGTFVYFRVQPESLRPLSALLQVPEPV